MPIAQFAVIGTADGPSDQLRDPSACQNNQDARRQRQEHVDQGARFASFPDWAARATAWRKAGDARQRRAHQGLNSHGEPAGNKCFKCVATLKGVGLVDFRRHAEPRGAWKSGSAKSAFRLQPLSAAKSPMTRTRRRESPTTAFASTRYPFHSAPALWGGPPAPSGAPSSRLHRRREDIWLSQDGQDPIGAPIQTIFRVDL